MSYGFPRGPVTIPILSRDDLETVHNASLEALERTGVKFPSERCLKILEDAGCRIDRKDQIAYIPSYLVRESLKKGRSIVRLGARNPKYNIALDGRHVHVISWGTGNSTVDLDSRKRRPSVSDDIVKAAKIANALDSYHIFWPTVTSHDVSPHIRNIHDVRTSLMSSEKHVQFETGDDPVVARYIIDMAAAASGGLSELRNSPVISSCHCPISPLAYDGGSVEAALEYASSSVPVLIGTAPMPGASAPITLAGAMTLAHAEIMSGLTLIEAAYPGAPFIYGASVAPFDMRTARRAGGAVEHGLIDAAMAQLGRYCSLPSLAGAGFTTANEPGPQSCLEIPFCALLTFSNADIIEGFGAIEDGKTYSFEQHVINAEIVQMCYRATQGIRVDDATLALDVIDKVKPGGTFLAEKHTNDYLRKEHFIPNLIKRQSYDAWVKDGSKSIVDLAREKAKKILETTSIRPLEIDVQHKIANIVQEADKELSKSK